MCRNHWIWKERLEHQIRKACSPQLCMSIAFRPVLCKGTHKRQEPMVTGSVCYIEFCKLEQHSRFIECSLGTMITRKPNLWLHVCSILESVPVHMGKLCMLSWLGRECCICLLDLLGILFCFSTKFTYIFFSGGSIRYWDNGVLRYPTILFISPIV